MPTESLNELVVIHTNSQSAMNKKSEIRNLIDVNKPHVLALTEFGAACSISDSELGVDGYTLYRGDHSDGKGGLGRGVGVYVHDSLNHSACPALDNEAFDCSTWSMIKLKNNKVLLLGVVYRSPNSSMDNNQKLVSMMRQAEAMKPDYLLICEDFNLPMIDWSLHQSRDSENSFSNCFLSMVDDVNLFQHVRDSTRFRGSQNSCLDLIFTNEENMVNEIEELPPLGKSDHVCQKWKLVVSEPIFRNTERVRLNFKRANWEAIKKELLDFSMTPNQSANAMNNELVEKINELKTKHIPLCRPKNVKNRLPWMRGASLKGQRSRKWKVWKRFKQSELPRDYDAYVGKKQIRRHDQIGKG